VDTVDISSAFQARVGIPGELERALFLHSMYHTTPCSIS
jgi:hypothetical protein